MHVNQPVHQDAPHFLRDVLLILHIKRNADLSGLHVLDDSICVNFDLLGVRAQRLQQKGAAEVFFLNVHAWHHILELGAELTAIWQQ